MTENDNRLIEQVAIRYAAAVDERDFQAFSACFAPNGVWAVTSGEQVGRKAIASYAERALGHLAGTQHLTTNFLIERAGDSAKMRSTFIATHIGAEAYAGQLCTIGGVYKDELVRLDSEWVFARREIVPLWVQGDTAMLGVQTRVKG